MIVLKNAKVWLLLILTTLFWAGNYVLGKYVVAEVSPVWITFSRWFLALFLLFPIAIYVEKPDWKEVKKSWFLLIILALLGIIGYNLLLYKSLEYTTATNAALINAINPGVIVLFSVLLLSEKLTKIQLSGLFVSLFGALILLTQGNILSLFTMAYNQGDVLMLVAVLVWTFYSIFGKMVSVPPITTTAVSALIAVIILAPFAFMEGIPLVHISPLAGVGIMYMVIFPSVFSFVFWNKAVRSIGASQAGIFLNLVPVFTALLGLFLGETLRTEQIIGGFLVFIGVYLTSGMVNKRVEKEKMKGSERKVKSS